MSSTLAYLLPSSRRSSCLPAISSSISHHHPPARYRHLIAHRPPHTHPSTVLFVPVLRTPALHCLFLSCRVPPPTAECDVQRYLQLHSCSDLLPQQIATVMACGRLPSRARCTGHRCNLTNVPRRRHSTLQRPSLLAPTVHPPATPIKLIKLIKPSHHQTPSLSRPSPTSLDSTIGVSCH